MTHHALHLYEEPDERPVRWAHPIAEGIHAADEARQYLKAEGLPAIPWGLTDLDDLVGGALPGQFIVIGARPNNGKTTFLLNWLDRLHADPAQRVCYIGTETSPPTFYTLWAAHRLQLASNLVLAREWAALPEGAQARLDSEIARLGSDANRVWVVDCPTPNLADVQDALTLAASGDFRATVVIFDHLHRMTPRAGQSERDALTEACRMLSGHATDTQTAVIVASQLRREDDRHFDKYRPPYLGSFLGSSTIEQEAHVALGLYRPLHRMSVKEERDVRSGLVDIGRFTRSDTMAIKVLKHRLRNDAIDKTVLVHVADGKLTDHTFRPEPEHTTARPPSIPASAQAFLDALDCT